METGKEYKSQDYCAGYYWSNHPCGSNDLSWCISDEQLEYGILGDLKKNNIMKSHMTIYVKEGVVIPTGYMKTYTERQLIGQQPSNTHVITEPESWSNQGVINEGELISE